MESRRKRVLVLWMHFLLQDLKSNEPRLNDINKVADELLIEKLLTPEGAHIRQVITGSLHSCSRPDCVLESSFYIGRFNFLFQRPECEGSVKLAVEKTNERRP